MDNLKTGINGYNTKVISMYDKDGDTIFDKVEEKLRDKEEITKQDLVALTFSDIAIKAIEMGLENDAISKRTDKEINILRRAKNN